MATTGQKHVKKGARDAIILVPQPSDDPKDPLNWPAWKKHTIFFALCLGAFGGVASTSVTNLVYYKQARTYHRDPISLSYAISAGIAGVISGPFLFVPLTSIFGRSSIVLWSEVGTLACNIWAPLMTGPNDYVPFVISRLFAGMFGSIAVVLAAGYLFDLYFLHQRGKAFAVLEVALLMGYIVTPSLGGFIVNSKPWPYVFWWLVAVNGFTVILSFVVLEETGFKRGGPFVLERQPKRSYVSDRIATFLPGTAVVPHTTVAIVVQRYITPFLVAFSPVTLIAGAFVIPVVGFIVGVSVATTIFLQTPVRYGGYGFTPLQNAAFFVSGWCGLIACQVCAYFLNDRVPLYIARRTGAWHPEYRLSNILLVCAAAPIGLGMYGAALQYHTHYMVLALGTFFLVFAGTYSTPITVNYVVECFPEYALEVSIVLSFCRQLLGLALPFFIFTWVKRVGAGWAFGTMAFICLFVSLFMVVVLFKGRTLRQYNLVSAVTEDGVEVVVKRGDSETSVGSLPASVHATKELDDITTKKFDDAMTKEPDEERDTLA